MKKKLLSVLLSAAMVVTLAACGNDGGDTTATGTDTSTEGTTEAGATEGEAIPTPNYYYSFDAADDSAAIMPTERVSGNMEAIDKEKKYIPGVKGDSLYCDGLTGYTLTDVNGVGDSYTISYWTYCRRSALYMSNTIWGPDIHGDKAIGGELWASLDWLASEDGSTNNFPSIWSNDALGVGRASYTIAENSDGVGQWMHVALVVDANSVSADGLCNIAKLYINGEEYVKEMNGEVAPINVVKGTMTPSDTFEFLLGMNYWDSIFKGAFDELYIFDSALTPGQIKTMYLDGDATVAFEEPERVITVVADENAIDSVGAMDYSNEFASDFSEPIDIKDGQTIQVKMKNWSDGNSDENNYAIQFYSETGHLGMLKANLTGVYGSDGDSEVAIPDTAFSWDWGNWATWEKQVMVEADVTLTITRDGENVHVEMDNVDYNGTSNIGKADLVFEGYNADMVMGFAITNGHCYTDILSVKDKTVSAGGIIVGNTDCVTPFWTAFSNIYEIPEGATVTKNFTNYTDGANNWDNFLVILQNTPTGHSADDAEGYAEYAVLRADNFGWGAGYDGIATTECDWNWDTFLADMDGANVSVSITNNGATADVVAIATTPIGVTYTQKYLGIATDGPLYACFTCENAYLSFDVATVGNTDCTTPFWTAFSDIWSVPVGESKTVYFKNYTDGVNNWDNFLVALQNVPGGHSADAYEGYAEYAVLRADNFGWGVGYDGIVTPECDWNWDTFASDMDGAYVALTVTNNCETADVNAVVTTAAGVQYHQSYPGIAIDGDLYFTLLCEAAYLQVEGQRVGNVDCTTGFWTQFSNIYPVTEGESKSVSLSNYTDGINNWDNFCVVLQTTPTGHAGTTEGYAEYAVVRADNYGWGAGYEGIAATECDWVWDTFLDDMNGAHVNLTVTNNGSTADIRAVVTTAAGKVYTQKYTGIAIDGDLYFTLLCEGAYLMVD